MVLCPSPQKLQQLMAELLARAEAEPLEAHIENCAVCQQALEGLMAANLTLPLGPGESSTSDNHPTADGAGDFLRRLAELPDQATYATNGCPAPPPLGAAQPVIAGYEILGVLGQGGMGVVYRAWQIQLKRVVALKMISAGGQARANELARFRIEAEAAARLQHPNIVQVHDVGEVDSRPYLALEFVGGGSLADKLHGTPLPPRQAAQLLETLARTMHYAHQRGVLHRDLKPSNILLSEVSDQAPVVARDQEIPPSLATDPLPPTAVPKITDFGLAKLTIGGGSDQTHSGAILGTPSYMAPEQAAGKNKEISTAVDIYSLGAMLYELLTGRPPFSAETPLDTVLQVIEREPVAPSVLQPRVPRDLETICLKCLQKEPQRRYASAAELADDLRCFLRDQPIRARPIGQFQRTWRWCRRNPVVAGLLAFVGLLLAVLALGALIANLLLQNELQETARAETLAKDKLILSDLERARSASLSRQVGQQFRSLEALSEAARLAREQNAPAERMLDLRNVAIACLASPDLQKVNEQDSGVVEDFGGLACDSTLDRYAIVDPDRHVVIRRFADNRLLHRLAPPPDTPFWYVHPLFSPDGKLLLALYPVAGKGERCIVWDLSSGQQILSVMCSGWPAFGPDSATLAAPLEDGTIQFLELPSGREIGRVGKDLRGSRLGFDPTGRRLLRCAQRQLQILDAGTGTVRSTFAHEDFLHTAAWSHDGRWLATGGEDRRIYVYDTVEGRLHSVLEGHEGPVIHLQFSPTETLLASASWDGTTRLWDPISGRELLSGAGGFLRFSQDGRRLGLCERRPQISIWELANAFVCRTLHQGCSGNRTPWTRGVGPVSVDFSRDGRLLASTAADGVRLWDAHLGRQLAHLHIGLTQAAQFNPVEDSLLTYGQLGVHLWPITRAGGSETDLFRVGPSTTLHATASRSWCRVAWAGTGKLLAFAQNAQNRALAVRLEDPQNPMILPDQPRINSIALSPDGKWAAATGWKDAHATAWRVEGPAPTRLPTRSPDTFANSTTFTPDGEWLVLNTTRDYQWLRVGTWEPGLRISKLSETGNAPVAFSPDGRLLAITRTPQTIQLIDPTSGDEFATLASPDRRMISWLCFSPDGSRLAVAAQDDVILLWDLRNLRRRLAELGLDWALPAYSPDGEAENARPLRVFVQYPPANPGELLQKANDALARDPRNAQALWVRAQAHAVLNDLDKALTDADQLLATLPANDKLRGEVMLARAAWQLWHDTQKALQRMPADNAEGKKR
jgi:eukaryotic-like serine/threonine-protein kinase